MLPKLLLPLVYFLFFSVKLKSQQFNPNLIYNTISDIDGNFYKTIQIGTEIWMAENLSVTRFRNGVSIPQVSDSVQWKHMYKKLGRKYAWCYYNNNKTNNIPHGKLYNWYAVADSNGICPTGWHVANDADWSNLSSLLNQELAEEKKTHSSKNEGVTNPIPIGKNSTGFISVFSGVRRDDGVFTDKERSSSWWRIDGGCQVLESKNRTLGAMVFHRFSDKDKMYGFSVRCVKD
jgi:uncharacterized protein (TIGR02145 family)